jgi:Winged helix DNA-binding domain
MVGDLDLARWRLRTQHLVEPHLATAAEVVGALLAVQAENMAQSAWAVAARTAAPDPGDLAGLLDDGKVVRTHVLRPTWHFVAADDIAWLVELTAPRVRRTTQQQLRAVHGMDDRAIDDASTAVLEALDAPSRERPSPATMGTDRRTKSALRACDERSRREAALHESASVNAATLPEGGALRSPISCRVPEVGP